MNNKFKEDLMKKLIFAIALLTTSICWAKMQEVNSFGSNPGNLTMYQYIPEKGSQQSFSIIVALHGCTQTAEEYNQRSGWTDMGDISQSIIIFPEQRSANNPMMCFNWGGEYGDQTNLIRGKGENQSIIQMIEKVKKSYPVDEDKIFIAGFSAGGALAANMLALYPDIFKGGAIMSGIPYRCATSLIESFTCMFQGRDLSAQQWGDLARKGFSYKGQYPKVSLWHGSSDYTVSPTNADQLVKQWQNLHKVTGSVIEDDLGDNHRHLRYLNDRGDNVIHYHLIQGMGHAITVNPNGDFSGGSSGEFGENRGIHSTLVTVQEWGLL